MVVLIMTIDGQDSSRLRNGVTQPDGEPALANGDSPAPDRALLTHAMSRLSSDYRALVHRAYFHGWTTAQIAADLGITEGSVKTQLHYALRALQQTLREMGVAR